MFEIVVKIKLLSRYPFITRQLESDFLDDRQHVASENTCHQEVSMIAYDFSRSAKKETSGTAKGPGINHQRRPVLDARTCRKRVVCTYRGLTSADDFKMQALYAQFCVQHLCGIFLPTSRGEECRRSIESTTHCAPSCGFFLFLSQMLQNQKFICYCLTLVVR